MSEYLDTDKSKMWSGYVVHVNDYKSHENIIKCHEITNFVFHDNSCKCIPMYYLDIKEREKDVELVLSDTNSHVTRIVEREFWNTTELEEVVYDFILSKII